jgi:hypothetical protein
MTIDTNRLAGKAYLSVDGASYMLRGKLAYGVSSVKRETKSGQDGVHGYGEMPIPGFISGTLSDAGGLTVADFNAMTNVTVVAELANGKTVIARNAWTVEAQEVDTEEATFDVRWESRSVEEA